MRKLLRVGNFGLSEGGGTRTHDLGIKSPLLYQLSYAPAGAAETSILEYPRQVIQRQPSYPVLARLCHHVLKPLNWKFCSWPVADRQEELGLRRKPARMLSELISGTEGPARRKLAGATSSCQGPGRQSGRGRGAPECSYGGSQSGRFDSAEWYPGSSSALNH